MLNSTKCRDSWLPLHSTCFYTHAAPGTPIPVMSCTCPLTLSHTPKSTPRPPPIPWDMQLPVVPGAGRLQQQQQHYPTRRKNINLQNNESKLGFIQKIARKFKRAGSHQNTQGTQGRVAGQQAHTSIPPNIHPFAHENGKTGNLLQCSMFDVRYFYNTNTGAR